MRVAAQIGPPVVADQVCTVSRQHQGHAKARRQRRQDPHVLAVDNVRPVRLHFLADRLRKRADILFHLAGRETFEGRRAPRVRGKTGKIEGQRVLGRHRRHAFLGVKEHRMQTDAGDLLVVRGVFRQHDGHFVTLCSQLHSQVLRIGAAARSGQRKVIDHQDLHERDLLYSHLFLRKSHIINATMAMLRPMTKG